MLKSVQLKIKHMIRFENQYEIKRRKKSELEQRFCFTIRF